jgi:hypothetical protein
MVALLFPIVLGALAFHFFSFETELQLQKFAFLASTSRMLSSSMAACLRPYVDPGKRMQESQNIQKPHNHTDHYNSVQDRLDRSSHRYEVIDQPQQNAHDD